MEPAGNRQRPPGTRWPRTAIGSSGSLQPKKVLVCDDERHVVRLIQVYLERAGHTALTAFDGKEALDKVRSEKPDLCILAVLLRHMDGFEVLKAIRKDPEAENIPVIMLIAKAQDKDVFEGYHYGADLYLAKPINPAELDWIVRMLD